jgi:hypothetical protein
MHDLRRLALALHESGAEFVVIGGIAAIAQGATYMTEDLDVCYARTPENYSRIGAALKPFNPRLRGAPPGLPLKFDPPTIRAGLNFTLTTDEGDLDLLGEVSGLGGFEAVKAQSVKADLFDCSLWVLTLADPKICNCCRNSVAFKPCALNRRTVHASGY